jgi:FkbM family methyltransferase
MSIAGSILENLRDGAKLGPTFPLRHLSALLSREYHVTHIKQAGRVHIRPKGSDAATFIQVFRKREYDLSGRGQFSRVMTAYQRILDAGRTPIIIDAGANVGAASIWFAKQFPMARVLAVEPDASNAEVCRLNTRALPNVNVIEAAIGSERGRVSLSNPEKQAWMIQTTRSDNGEVAICTILELAHDVEKCAKLFVVKIDIEGFEVDLFANNTQWIDEAEVIMIEPHDWLFPGKGTSRNCQREIAARNFELLILYMLDYHTKSANVKDAGSCISNNLNEKSRQKSNQRPPNGSEQTSYQGGAP